MSLYPLFLKLKDVKCLVIGGGVIAERKVRGLLEAKAIVTVISPSITVNLRKLSDECKINHIKKIYEPGDLTGFFLVIASTCSSEVNKKIFEEATKKNMLINSVDDNENCNFYLSSVLKRGDLQIAVSTSGKLPFLARKLKDHIERKLYGTLDKDLLQLQELRCKVIAETNHNQQLKVNKFKELIEPKIDEIIKKIERE